jgi:hypothetical protein
MAKERSINPAAAQRKADKKKEIAKSRRTQETQRNEKLARRNPERLQRQVDELKELEAHGSLRPKDKETLAQLEKDLKGVRRAREALGVKDEPRRDGRWNGQSDARQEQRDRRQHLGKRRREDEHKDGSDTDPEVRAIPMPRDTPPPIPREPFHDPRIDANGQRVPHALPSKPASTAPVPTLIYGAAPQIRDLKKEAVKFMPSVVSQQRSRVKGQGRLLEPEELDKLEKSGYMAAKKAASEAGREARLEQASVLAMAEADGVDLDDELNKFEREMSNIYPTEAEQIVVSNAGDGTRKVQLEEIEDEGD